jgi:nucleotide-binding universal stress UspA family protein
MITLNKVLVATDFSDVADAALTYGSELARRFGARLHVIHIAENAFMLNVGAAGYVSDVSEIQREIDEEARRQIEACTTAIEPRPTTTIISAGSSPAYGIIDYAKEHDIDLIVIGTHGRGGVTRMLLGSVAEKVVRTAPCPVLTVHRPEHEFVVPDVQRAEAVA